MERRSIQFDTPPSGVRLRGAGAVSVVDLPLVKNSAVVTAAQFPQESLKPPAPPEPDLRPLLESLISTMTEMEERRRQSLSELQHIAVELAVAVASQLVSHAIDREQFAVEELVTAMVQKTGLTQPVTVALHPADLKLLEKRLTTMPQSWNRERVTLLPDHGVARGGCRAELPDGQMLISEVTSRLSEIRRHWMEELDDAQIERRSVAGEGPPLRRFPDRRETA